MIYLVFGLHMYQPPTQTPEIMEQVKNESYLPLLSLIAEHPNAFFNLDICMSVIELAQRYGHHDMLEKLQECQKKEKINLVTSGMYHPIFPLIPQDVVVRQIRMNNKAMARLFSGNEKYKTPLGVFPPEMAFSKDILGSLKEAGALWTVTEDVPFCEFYRSSPPYNRVVRYNGMYILLRSNMWTKQIAFHMPGYDEFFPRFRYDQKKWYGGEDGYIVLWLDFETFGHHDRKCGKNLISDFLTPMLDRMDGNVTLASPEQVIERFEALEKLVPSGSWSTDEHQFRRGEYYPLWNHPHCEFHRYWWHLAHLCYRMVADGRNRSLIHMYDRAINSCQCWQYSFGRKELAGLGIPMFAEIIEQSAHSLRGEAAQALRTLKRLVE